MKLAKEFCADVFRHERQPTSLKWPETEIYYLSVRAIERRNASNDYLLRETRTIPSIDYFALRS